MPFHMTKPKQQWLCLKIRQPIASPIPVYPIMSLQIPISLCCWLVKSAVFLLAFYPYKYILYIYSIISISHYKSLFVNHTPINNSKNPPWPGLETARPASDRPPAGARHAHATMAPGCRHWGLAFYGKIYGENQGFPRKCMNMGKLSFLKKSKCGIQL
jgi:hypothetical protein